MISRTNTCAYVGVEGYNVICECDLSGGLPAFDVVGLPDTSVREARDRVRSAIKNCGFDFPLRRITINLAPAQLKKTGTLYDLPILLGILASSGQISPAPSEYAFIGELSLDGNLRPVNGVLPMTMAAKEAGFRGIFLPKENSYEASVVEGIEVLSVDHISQVIAHLRGETTIAPCPATVFVPTYDDHLDYCDVIGQESAKRAMMIAAAGGHNLLMIGPPGSGKSMLAQRMPTILPEMTYEEALETTKIYSVLGRLTAEAPLMAARPFRAPHHTLSGSAMVGGSSTPRPGEISMCHNGVLFMDELPEFHADVLEVLRQPMEDGFVTVSRASGSATYPSRFVLIAAMNPCKCGYYGFDDVRCKCSDNGVKRYRKKISGPLLDRIDLHITVEPVAYGDLSKRKQGETSLSMRNKVNTARRLQQKRYKLLDFNCNGQLPPGHIVEFCTPDQDGNRLLELAFSRLGLSARGHDKILKVARTIADLEDCAHINGEHIAEAIEYRTLDRED